MNRRSLLIAMSCVGIGAVVEHILPRSRAVNAYEVAKEVNDFVNATTRWKSDQDNYGVEELWVPAVPGGFEDCDGFVLEKWERLLDRGWPIDKLGICTCVDETRQHHVVLAAETDRGWFILDNRQRDLIRPTLLPYTWETMQCGDKWRQLSWA